jgi:hypothetical protein
MTRIPRKNPGLLGLTDDQIRLVKVTRRRIAAMRAALDDVERALEEFAADPSPENQISLTFAITDDAGAAFEDLCRDVNEPDEYAG